jgi:hypothetical protein
MTADQDGGIRTMLELRAMVQESDGVPAGEAELLDDDRVRPGRNLWVKVTRAEFEDEPHMDPLSVPPVFHLVVADGNHRPLHHLGVDAMLATETLGTAYTGYADQRVPAEAFEVEEVRKGVLRRGEKCFLTITMHTFEHPPPGSDEAGDAIRYAVLPEADLEADPLYSFIVNWPDAFLLFTVAF